jgi:hypothetical protein
VARSRVEMCVGLSEVFADVRSHQLLRGFHPHRSLVDLYIAHSWDV